MPLVPLAIEEDVSKRFIRALSDAEKVRVAEWLEDASNRARAAAQGQQISLVQNDVVVLGGGGTRLVLPQRPISAVTAAADGSVTLASAAWAWDGQEMLRRRDGYLWPARTTVTYTHGLEDGEWGRELARGIVCDAVVRALLVEYPGLRSETVLGRSYTFDERFRGGGAVLTAEDEERLDRTFGRD